MKKSLRNYISPKKVDQLRTTLHKSHASRLLLWIFICLAYLHLPSAVFADFPAISDDTPTVIPAAPPLAAKSYILVDYASDYVISENDADQRVEPASLTKMMTVYVLDQAIKNNKIKADDKITISEKAWRTSGSRMFLDLNSEVPIEELLKGIIIQSGNDASVAIAEHIAGSEATFAEIMNFYAKQLGMNNTHFVNSTGLPDPNHYTTARDMAKLARALIRDFPESYKLYSQKEFMYKNIKQTNRNRLLWKDDWIDGIKTGHTDNAGFCLVASGVKDGMRLISVLMGAKNDAVRTDETNKLLTYGYRFYETRKLYPKGTPIQQAKVWMGKENEVGLGVAEDFYVTIGRGQSDNLKANLTMEKKIKAPIAEGAKLGTLSILLDDKVIAEKPVVAMKAIPAANIFSRMYDHIVLAFLSLWERITS